VDVDVVIGGWVMAFVVVRGAVETLAGAGTALVCANGTTTGGFTLWAAGAGAGVGVIGGGTATSLVLAGVFVVVPVCVVVLVSSAKAATIPAAKTRA
jgi:hypothetical protein